MSDLAEVEHALQELSIRTVGPFVAILPREPGKREQRWTHLFSGAAAQMISATGNEPEQSVPQGPGLCERVTALESEVAIFRETLNQIQNDYAEFKRQFS